MRVNFSQKTDSGPVTFDGEFNTEEVGFLVEYAVTDLAKKGLVPISVSKEASEISKFAPGTQTEQ